MITGQISHYRILNQLGVGGMGEVYLAEDTRLDRSVALKLLPEQFTRDEDRVRRFIQEAKAASALNHPNIITIHEIGQTESRHYIATEFIEGETLRQKLSRGPLTVNESLEVGIQVTGAIGAAHKAGVIHRDIKPENVMLRGDGIVKVLDFGLAKLTEQRPETVDGESPNIAKINTDPGTVMGTASYMSPEQARGQEVDARSDIFSLGVLLYEMVAGHAPFAGVNAMDVIGAILNQEPAPLAPRVAGAPREQALRLEQIVGKALRKERNERYQTVNDLLADLKDLKQELEFVARLSQRSGVSGKMAPPEAEPGEGPSTMDIAHVLFCDIVGYSILPIDRQKRMISALQEIVRQTEDYRRADSRSQLVRLPAGDGMALAFLQDPVAPARCAFEIARALQSYPEIRLRMGIHSGPVFLSTDINGTRNVVGSGINMAQRVMDSGDAGHILVSRNVAEVLSQVSDWQSLLHDLGEREVKHGVQIRLYNLYTGEVGNSVAPSKIRAGTSTGVKSPSNLSPGMDKRAAEADVLSPRRPTGAEDESSMPVPTSGHEATPTERKAGAGRRWLGPALLGVLLLAGVGLWLYFHATKQIESIAVLPFVNASGNADVEPLSDGMTEMLIGSLSQLPKLNVKGRSSVFRYKGKEFDLPRIARELKVQAILTGRVAQLGDQLTLSLELVDAQTENAIWGEQYNRRLADLVTLQSEIARDVSSKLKTKLSGEDEQKLTKKYTDNAEAYQFYLKGRFFLNRRTLESLQKAIEYFNQAITIDPNYALGYAGLADSYLLLGLPDATTGALSPQDSVPKARAAAEKALQIDNSVGEVYFSLGQIKSKEHDWAAAESAFDRGIKLSPNYPIGRLYYSVYLSTLGRQDEALKEIRRAQELDPLSLPVNASVIYVLYFGRQYDEAIAAGKKTLEMDASFPLTHQRLGLAYIQKKMYREAILSFQQAANNSNRAPLAIISLGHAYAVSGNKVEAQKVLAELKVMSQRRYVSPYSVATIYAGLGEKEQAFQWLQKANDERNTELVFLKIDPRLDPLRGDPRFQELVKSVGFPK